MSKVTTVDEFKALVNEIREDEHYRDPIMFGISRNDMGVLDKSKTLQCNYMTCNVGENLGSAAIYQEAINFLDREALQNLENDNALVVHKSDSEITYSVTKEFLETTLEFFTPYLEEVDTGKHLNIDVINNLLKFKEMLDSNEQAPEFNTQQFVYRLTFIYEDKPCETVESAFLKLYALSEGKSPLRSLNLDGIFGLLTNCAFLADGTVLELEVLRINRMRLIMTADYPQVLYVDKFPRYLQHIIPNDNTRILDTSKVRFGAQLSAGTTVMPGASYINFNAGTTGPCMVEGRISSSAVVGANSDIGGGASILGVLSGTDGTPISVGERCLLGANSTCGIPVGDDCVIDAGLAILSGTKIHMTLKDWTDINSNNESTITFKDNGIYKASELSGYNGVHYRRDSVTGSVVAKLNTKLVELNQDLH